MSVEIHSSSEVARDDALSILIAVGIFGLLLGISFLDYITGYEISFLLFYLFPILLAVWFVGWRYAVFIAIMSIPAWLIANIYSGKVYSNKLAPVWNGTMRFTMDMIVIWLFSLLKSSRDNMEQRIKERTSALANEVAERKLLEKKILTVVEREQERIGHDLHDGLCQHLTGTAIATQILVEKLHSKSQAEAQEARRIVELVEEGIAVARNIARGLSPVPAGGRGIFDALQELSETTQARFNVECTFQYDLSASFNDGEICMHFYRIAQEAISNAVRHGKATKIALSLYRRGNWVFLTIRDNGCGWAEVSAKKGGMGMHIMKHRATMIGGELEIRGEHEVGTIVTCSFKIAAPPEEAVI